MAIKRFHAISDNTITNAFDMTLNSPGFPDIFSIPSNSILVF